MYSPRGRAKRRRYSSIDRDEGSHGVSMNNNNSDSHASQDHEDNSEQNREPVRQFTQKEHSFAPSYDPSDPAPSTTNTYTTETSCMSTKVEVVRFLGHDSFPSLLDFIKKKNLHRNNNHELDSYMFKARVDRGQCPYCGNQTHEKNSHSDAYDLPRTVPSMAVNGVCVYEECPGRRHNKQTQDHTSETHGVQAGEEEVKRGVEMSHLQKPEASRLSPLSSSQHTAKQGKDANIIATVEATGIKPRGDEETVRNRPDNHQIQRNETPKHPPILANENTPKNLLDEETSTENTVANCSQTSAATTPIQQIPKENLSTISQGEHPGNAGKEQLSEEKPEAGAVEMEGQAKSPIKDRTLIEPQEKQKEEDESEDEEDSSTFCKCLKTFNKVHSQAVWCIAALPPRSKSSSNLAFSYLTGTADASIQLWDVTKTRDQTNNTDDTECKNTWKQAQVKCRRTYRGHKGVIRSLALLHHGPPYNSKAKQFLSVSSDRTAKLWNLRDAKACVRTYKGHTDTVWCVCVVDESLTNMDQDTAEGAGPTAFVTGSYDRTAKLWHVSSSKEVKTFLGHSCWVTSVAHALVRGVQESCDKQENNFRKPTSCLLTASRDTTARLWNLSTGQLIRCYKGHESAIWSLAVVQRDGGHHDHFVTGANNGSLKIWDIPTGACVHTLEAQEGFHDSISNSTSSHIEASIEATEVYCVAVMHQGDAIVSASRNGTIQVWRSSEQEKGDEVDAFQNQDVDPSAFGEDQGDENDESQMLLPPPQQATPAKAPREEQVYQATTLKRKHKSAVRGIATVHMAECLNDDDNDGEKNTFVNKKLHFLTASLDQTVKLWCMHALEGQT